MATRSSKVRSLLLAALALALYLLHQDYWNWKAYKPLIFGFLPIGLAYHAAYSIAAAIMMVLFVKFAWPRHLEEIEQHQRNGRSQSAPGSGPKSPP